MQLRAIIPFHVLEARLICSHNLMPVADLPVSCSCKASCAGHACTGLTRGCLAFMESVSHSLVWHMHTSILLEGITKAFGSVPPVLSHIKEQTAPCCCPSTVLSPRKDLNPRSNMMGVQSLHHRTNKATHWMKVWIAESFLAHFVTENQMLRSSFLAVTFYFHLSLPLE